MSEELKQPCREPGCSNSITMPGPPNPNGYVCKEHTHLYAFNGNGLLLRKKEAAPPAPAVDAVSKEAVELTLRLARALFDNFSVTQEEAASWIDEFAASRLAAQTAELGSNTDLPSPTGSVYACKNWWKQQHDIVVEQSAAARGALEKLRKAVDQVGYETGICCCGGEVNKHTIGDGHSPVDQGAYYMEPILAEVDALLSGGTPAPEGDGKEGA
jgi:hypothetical protein